MASSNIKIRRELNLIILGKTGEGKSSTGNLILGRKAYDTSNGKSSCTKDHELCSVDRNDDLRINIVDTPGLCDTATKKKETLEKITDAVSKCSGGFDAFLFVLNYSGRFTAESTDTLRILKESFGPQLLKHCIIVVTHGSDFDMNCDKSFEKWCEEQDGSLATLLKECDNRVVLFYNKIPVNKKTNKPKDHEDVEKQQECVEKLIRMVKRLPGRYTNDYFKQCAIARDKIAMEEDLPALKSSIQNKLSGLIASFYKALSDIEKEQNIDMSGLCNEARELVKEIEKTQGKTDVLKELRDKAVNIQNKIDKLYNAKEEQEALINQIIQETEALKNPPSKLNTWFKYVTGVVGSVLLVGVSALSVAAAPAGFAGAGAGIILATNNLKNDLDLHDNYDARLRRLEQNKTALSDVKNEVYKLHE